MAVRYLERGGEEDRKSRLWDLKSTSKAACEAYDKRPQVKARAVGFVKGR